jgi:hypothetical protein
MGIRKTVTGQGNILKNKGNERTGIQKWRNNSGHIPFYRGNKWMRLRHVVAYWVGSGPSWVFTPSGYLCSWPSFPSQSLVVCILSAVTDTVPSDSKSIAWTGWLDVDAHLEVEMTEMEGGGDDGDRTGGIVDCM